MENEIKEIIAGLKAGIEGEGGKIELTGVQADGTICLQQQEDCACCLATVWTHRLRVERAIKKEFPEAKIEVQLVS